MHTFDYGDALSIRNKIDGILLDIRAASQTSPGKPYPEFVKEVVKKLTEAREVLVKRFGISR